MSGRGASPSTVAIVGAVDLADRDEARIHRRAVEQDGARPALAFAAAFLRAGQGEVLAEDVEQAAHARDVHLDAGGVDREAVGGHGRAGGRGLRGARRERRRAGTPARAARIRSGLAGRSAIQAPVASAIAATTAGAPTSIGSSPTPFAPCGDAVERRLDEDRRDPRGVQRGRDDVGREPIVEVAPVAQLDLLDRGVADRLERAALDLALGEDRVDDPPDVVDGDDVADLDLAGVEVDVDASRRRPPSRMPGRRRRGRSRRRSRRRGTARSAGRSGPRRWRRAWSR